MSTLALNLEQLEQGWDDACMAAVAECRQLGYPPNWFTSRRAQVGPRQTAREFMAKPLFPMPEGFSRCVELNRIDLTLEATLWDNPHFIALFVDTPEVITRAIQRLVNIEYIVPTTQP